MNVFTLAEAKSLSGRISPGDKIAFQSKEGSVRIETIRIKEVRCGKKNCKQCPHKRYAYAQYRVGKKVTEKYIGVAR